MIVAHSGIDFFTERALIDISLDRSEIGPVVPECSSSLTDKCAGQSAKSPCNSFDTQVAHTGPHSPRDGNLPLGGSVIRLRHLATRRGPLSVGKESFIRKYGSAHDIWGLNPGGMYD